MNRPAVADEDDAGVSSPNSTVSTVSGKRSSGERESAGAGEDNEVERASSRGLSDDEDAGENSRKKLRLTKEQSAILEESFKEHNTLNPVRLSLINSVSRLRGHFCHFIWLT